MKNKILDYAYGREPGHGILLSHTR